MATANRIREPTGQVKRGRGCYNPPLRRRSGPRRGAYAERIMATPSTFAARLTALEPTASLRHEKKEPGCCPRYARSAPPSPFSKAIDSFSSRAHKAIGPLLAVLGHRDEMNRAVGLPSSFHSAARGENALSFHPAARGSGEGSRLGELHHPTSCRSAWRRGRRSSRCGREAPRASPPRGYGRPGGR